MKSWANYTAALLFFLFGVSVLTIDVHFVFNFFFTMQIKGDILRRCGDLAGAAESVDFARSLDLADRYINSSPQSTLCELTK